MQTGRGQLSRPLGRLRSILISSTLFYIHFAPAAARPPRGRRCCAEDPTERKSAHSDTMRVISYGYSACSFQWEIGRYLQDMTPHCANRAASWWQLGGGGCWGKLFAAGCSRSMAGRGDAGPELHVHASREDGRAGDNNAHTEPVRSYELGYSCGVLRNSRVEVEVGDSLVSWSS